MSDQAITEADLTGDGVNDAMLIDSDGDGMAETVVSHDASGGLDIVSDTDHDGVYDTESLDTDGDGVIDTRQIDSDGDGSIDAVQYDSNGDGVADVTTYDLDGDGNFETTATDADGDGTDDVVEFDLDGDGATDVIDVAGQTLTLDGSGHVVSVTPNSQDPATAPDPTSDGTHADPATGVDPQDVPDAPGAYTTTGDPATDPATSPAADPAADPDATERAEDAQDWFQQSEDGFCAPSSVAMIVAEYSDQPVANDAAFVQRAEELGFLTYDQAGGSGWSGITVEQTKELLESFGVQARVETGTIDSLDQYLDNGYNAIVAIDSSEIWYGKATGVMDHAVVVSSIENGMVYLNDPGTPDGKLEAVPVEVFEKAWSASNDAMVVTENPDTAAPTPGVGPDVFVEGGDLGARVRTGAGTILLPIKLEGDDIREWHNLNG